MMDIQVFYYAPCKPDWLCRPALIVIGIMLAVGLILFIRLIIREYLRIHPPHTIYFKTQTPPLQTTT